MPKKLRAILPKYAYEIVMDIIKNNGLEKREELISEQLANSTDPKITKSLMDDRPLFILSIIARKAAEEELSEDEIKSLIMKELRIDEEKGKRLTQELKNKLIFFMEVVEIKEKEEIPKKERKISKEKSEEIPEEEKEEKPKTIDKPKHEEPDPYREEIE